VMIGEIRLGSSENYYASESCSLIHLLLYEDLVFLNNSWFFTIIFTVLQSIC
jgi:hypothetical protein